MSMQFGYKRLYSLLNRFSETLTKAFENNLSLGKTPKNSWNTRESFVGSSDD